MLIKAFFTAPKTWSFRHTFPLAKLGASLLSATLALGLSACASKVEYGDAQAVETVDVSFGSTDLQNTAAKMVDSLLTFPPVVQLTQTQRPIMFVDTVRNKTEEHIDTESITDSVVNKLLRSGKFQFVDMTATEAVAAQQAFQTQSGLVDPSKAAQFGKQVGAQYMLHGNLSGITKRNKKEKDVYYKMTLKMLDLTSGLLVWQEEKEIRKRLSRSVFGL
jgi:uncharacterized protein (TIGR02722 family)